MDIGDICLWILSLCALGFFQENKNGIDTSNTLMSWFEAQNYCQSLNSSLVDPFEYEISVNGSFWTNRHLAEYSSWIYITGCINTSSLNLSGRVVSSLGQCDSLCTHTSFFGIQNFKCVCLKSEEFVVRKTCNADCLKHHSPIKQCGRNSDLMTLYGKFTESIELKPGDGNCLVIDCERKTKFEFYPCDKSFQCICSKEEYSTFTEATARIWVECFDFCRDDTKFIWTATTCRSLGSTSMPSWIAVKRLVNDNKAVNNSEPFHCYKCSLNTSECSFESCFQKYLPRCKKIETIELSSTAREITLTDSIISSDSISVFKDRESSSKGIIFTMTTSSAPTSTKVIKDASHMTKNNNIGSDNKRVAIIIAVIVPCVIFIVITAAIFIIYRYRRMKAITNDGNLRVQFQNEYSEMNTTEMGNRYDTSDKQDEDKELPYVDSNLDVYDHLRERRTRKIKESDNAYNEPNVFETGYGDFTHTPHTAAEDMYDHTKSSKIDDSEYDSVTR